MKFRITFYLFILSLIAISCKARYYKPQVMPSGKSELTRKQIRQDFTN